MATRIVLRLVLTVGFTWVGARQRKFKSELRARAGVAGEFTTESFDALAHAAQSITFHQHASAPIIRDFEHAVAVACRKKEPASPRLRMADDVGYSFAHDEGGNAFLRGGHND